MSVTKITNANHYETEMQKAGPKLVVIDFSAEWCGPCRAIAPRVVDLAKEYPDVVFLNVDVDEVPDISAKAGISAMPTFHALLNGNKVGEVVGADKTKLENMIKEHLPKK